MAVLWASQSLAGGASVRDGGTLEVAGVTYRLDGIDAPELDQMCIDEHADAWACGVEARDQLSSLIGGRQVRCEDLGLGTAYKKRHIGICTVEGESTSLNQLVVRQGFALNFEPYGKRAIQGRRGRRERQSPGTLEGLLCSPPGISRGAKGRRLIGRMCRTDKDREIRAVLFPDEPAMPPGCSIKGKFAVRARFTGNVGVYHLQACRSYPALTKPDRWFCSEEDAQAAGFRKAYNCRAAGRDGCNKSVVQQN